ncbi:MAG: TlpA disulfide reductase family protein [Spirochaetia bacterium]|jgi:thiol-disulfide isomerase/thioredoxin
MTILRKGLLVLPALLVAGLLAACAPRPAAKPADTAPSPSPQGAAADPSDSSIGNVSQMLLKAGFAVPKAEVMATEFTLQSLDGKKVSLSSFKGKLVFLSFWATWCGPCKQELPSVQAMYNTLKAKGFEIIAVDVMEDQKTVSSFVKANAMTFPVLLDSSGSVGRDYDAGSIPTNYILDRNGKILARIVGYDGIEWTDPARIALFEKLLSL